MALTIMTNEQAINAQRHLENTTNNLNRTMEKLSSGSRINRAADDAAGLAISDTINATIRSLNQGVRNAHDGVSLVQIYEGGTSEMASMLIRVRELAMAAATDTINDRERIMINNEVQQLIEEVERVSHTTRFNGMPLLDGQSIEMEFQIGENNDPDVDRISFASGFVDLTASGLGVDDINVEEKGDAQEALTSVDEALFKINEVRARVGSIQSRLNTAISASNVFIENLSAARSRIRDTDLAVETSNLAKHRIIQQSGVAVLAQANNIPALALQLLG